MAVPNPTVKRPCPYQDYGCAQGRMIERDVYDMNNIRHFEYDCECMRAEGEKCRKEKETER